MSQLDIDDLQDAQPEKKGQLASAKANLGQLFNRENRLKLVLYCFVFISLIGVLSYLTIFRVSDEGLNDKQSSSGINVPKKGGAPVLAATGKESERYSRLVEEFNLTGLDNARQDNPSAHPIPVLGTSVNNEPSNDINFLLEPEPEPPQPVSELPRRNLSQQSLRPSKVMESAGSQDQELDQDLMADLSELINIHNKKPQPFHTVFENKDVANAPQAVASESQSATKTSSTGQGEVSKERESLVKMGDLYYGINQLALNSDYPSGRIKVELVGGRLDRAIAMGQFERKNDKLMAKLNKLQLPSGELLSINAIVLDPQTTLNAFASNVDYHTMYRYGWWGAGTILKAAGAVAEVRIKGNSTSNISDGVVVTDSEVEAKDEVLTALGSLGEDIGTVMQGRLETPPTVTAAINDGLGVLFNEPVYLDKEQ